MRRRFAGCGRRNASSFRHESRCNRVISRSRWRTARRPPTPPAWRYPGRWCAWRRRWTLSPEAALDALAASVADGTPLDWRQVEAEAAPPDRRLIRHLRLVENISSLYRSIPDLDDPITDGAPEGPRWGRLVLLERIGTGTSCDV